MSRLPSHLFQTYSSYKCGTLEVIQWLNMHTGHGCNHCSVNSVRTIEHLAQVAIEKKIKVPASVLRTLKRTIRARNKVAAYFCAFNNEEDESNSSHLFFTAVLLRIYQDLLALAATTVCEAHTAQECKDVLNSANVFACLNLCDSQASVGGNVRSRSCCSQSEKHVRHTSKGSANYDIIGETMTINLYLSGHEKILRLVQESWRGANHSFAIIVASLVSSVAYQELQALQTQLREYKIYDPETLVVRYEFCMRHFQGQRGLPEQEQVDAGQEESLLTSCLALRECWRAVVAYRTHLLAEGLRSIDPREYFPSSPDLRDGSRIGRTHCRDYLDLLMERMGQAMKLRSTGAAQIAVKSPVLQDFTRFILDEENEDVAEDTRQKLSSNANSLSTGILLLLQSSQDYLRPELESHLPRSNARVMTLKLASELKGGVEHVLKDLSAPCGCLEINGHKVLPLLSLTIHILDEFTSTKNFDLYHQNPWVSGTHMTHNLTMVSQYSLQTWHHGYFIGILLHVYNSLIVLGALERDAVPIMEKICDIFTDMVFLGSRPRRNLTSCFRRWSGARLKIPNNRCHTMHTHDRLLNSPGKKWTMKSIRDVSQGGDDPRRSFKPSKVSLFGLIATRPYTRDAEVLARIQSLNRKINPPTTNSKMSRPPSSTSPTTHISSIRSALLQEFHDNLPVAKLNYFKLYTTFCSILRRITSTDHPNIESESICSCVTDRILRAADRYVDDPQSLEFMEENGLVRVCVDVFKDVLTGKELVDFTWCM